VNDGSLRRRALDLAGSAERAHALGHGGEAEALGRGGGNTLAIVAEGEAEAFAPLLAAVLARGRLLQNIDGQCAGLAVTDGVGDAFLDAAIEREVDRLTVRIGQRAEGDGNIRVGMTALEARNQLVEELAELHPAERAGPQLLQECAIGAA